jgi:hypothetical protein
MPRAWKTPRPRRRKLRRLGIPEPVVRKPRYSLTRAIRRVSLLEMNEAEQRIGSLEIAHETDLKFLETLESFAVQMEGEDDLLLDEDPVDDVAGTYGGAVAPMAGAHEVQEATALPPSADPDALEEDDLEDIEPEPDEDDFVDLDAEIENIQASLEAEPVVSEDLEAEDLAPGVDADLVDVLEDSRGEKPSPTLAPPELPVAPPPTASPAALDDEPPTIIDAGRERGLSRQPASDIGAPPQVPADGAVVPPPPLPPQEDGDRDEDLDDDLDDMEPDTGELLAAVEQTYSELESLGESDGESELGDLEGGPDLESEGLAEIDAGPMQSWDGTSLDEYIHASPGEMGLASWDGDSLEEYIQWNPDAAEDLASWDGTSYEEYLAQRTTDVPPKPPTEGGRDSSAEVDAWLTEQKLPAPTADPAVDPLGLGDDPEADERPTASGDDDSDPAPPAGADGEPTDDDEMVASQAMEIALDEPAFSLDLEESGELELGLDVPDDDVPSSAVEVKSQNELIIQVGAGLDDALSAEPLSLVLDVEEGTGAETSVGPVDDLSTGLAIPRSASLAALTGDVRAAGTEPVDQEANAQNAAPAEPPGDESSKNQ